MRTKSGEQTLEARRAIAALKIGEQRTTLTRKELGETYPEIAWHSVKRPFDRVYPKISEADAFQWEYLRELEQRRRGAVARAKAERRAREKKARRAKARDLKKQKKAQAKADAEAARADAEAAGAAAEE